jgi:RecA-family ATPase
MNIAPNGFMSVADVRTGHDKPDYLSLHDPGTSRGEPGPAATPKPTLVHLPDLIGLAVPERKWLVQNWIPCGVVTGLYGDGGLGKSLLAQQLQTATALGLPWLGLPVERCPSLGIFCEDSKDELWRRQDGINGGFGCEYVDLSDVHWMPRLGAENLLMTFARNGTGELTQFHKHVMEASLDLRAGLLIVDTAADLFGGNENDRGQVRQFVSRALGSIAQAIDGAVVLCAHPSRSGLSSGEGDGGSTGWSNSLRSRLFLSAPEVAPGETPDADARILSRKKANYAARQDEILLRWLNGMIVEDAGYEASASSYRRAVEEVFMDLLDATNRENQLVSESRHAGNYAPALFAKRAEREGYRKPDFERALQFLLSKGAVQIVEFGPPSKVRRKLIRGEQK